MLIREDLKPCSGPSLHAAQRTGQTFGEWADDECRVPMCGGVSQTGFLGPG